MDSVPKSVCRRILVLPVRRPVREWLATRSLTCRTILSAILVASIFSNAAAEGPNRAGLVVQFGDGTIDTYCVEFTDPETTGYDLLLITGLQVEASINPGAGAFICGIGGEGCAVSDCMCEYPPNYWSYWHLAGEEWTYSQAGVSGHLVSSGDVDGWSWGGGNPPKVASFGEICPPPATDTPTPAATWTPSPTPPSTDTPIPTPTWTPPPSDTPTLDPPKDTPLASSTPLPAVTAKPAPTSTNVPTSTPTWARTVAPTLSPTTEPSNTPPRKAMPPPSATHTPSPQPVGEVPSSTPSIAAKESAASATPVPTRLADAVRSLSAKGAVPTEATAQVTGTANRASSLPALLTLGAGLAYIFFLFLLLLLAGIYVFARSRRR
jgi:hypothetical protein